MRPALFVGLTLATVAVAQTLAPAPGPRPAPPAFEKDDTPSIFAEDADLPRQVQVTVEFIEVSQADATRMLYKEKLGRQGDLLRTELQRLMDEEKGTMFGSMLVSARSGQKSTIESIREVLYPMEYNPPVSPGSVLPEVTKPNAMDPFMKIAIPSSFETRNTGDTLEIEPALSEDNRTIGLRFVPEMVFYTGDSVHQKFKDALGNETQVKMPLFYSMRLNTSLTLKDGSSQLAGVLSPKGSDGVLDSSKRLFVIVRADVALPPPNK